MEFQIDVTSLIPVAIKGSSKPDRSFDRHPAVERMVLGDVGDSLATLRSHLADVFTEQFDLTEIRMHHPGQHLDRGRLPGPVSSEQSID